jgi:acetyltransferase
VKGEKVAVVTNSGGPSILTADKAEEVGLTIAEPADGVKSQLYEFLPSHCSVSNPIDLTVEASEENYLRTIDVLLEQEYDSVIAINVATPFLDSYGLARGISEAAHRHEKPVAAVFMAGRIVESGIEKLREEGIPPFPTGERAAVVLRHMLEFSNRAAREVEGGPSRAAGQAGGEATRAARETGAGPGNTRPKAPLRLCDPVLEPEAVDFLENSGFSFPGHQFVSYDKANMEAALAKLSFPVVMKVVSPKIIHKSDSGGVMLGLETAEQVHEAFDTMSTTFSGQEFRGVMLYEQVPEALEIIVGLSRDADFGPVIAVGAGGIYTELMRDVSLRIAPFSREEARHMVEELAVYKLLEGFRGKPGLDIEAVVDCVMRLSEVALNYPQIRELDLNPVFVRENGALVGDVRILTR